MLTNKWQELTIINVLINNRNAAKKGRTGWSTGNPMLARSAAGRWS